MPDTNKTITAPEAANTASAAPVKAATAGGNKSLAAAPIKPASMSKPAVVTDNPALSPVQSKDAPKTPTATPAKPAAAAQGRTSATALVAKPATGSKPEESATKPAGTTVTPAQPEAKTAAPAKSATANKPGTSTARPVGSSTATSPVQPKASAAPKSPTASPVKSAAAAQGKAPAAQPADKSAATTKLAGTEKPAADQPQRKVTAGAPAKSAGEDKQNLPSANTGNDLEKKEDGKPATSRGGKLVIPDLILTAHPVVTTVEKITSRLSPGMKLVLFCLLVPTFLSLIYFGLWASPMYIAEARFAVRGAESGAIETGGLASMLLPAGSTIGTDVNIVTEYIQSPDIMEAVDKELHIFDHFASHDYDIISRLESDATRDERLDYWQWAVKPSLDPETGIVALSVKAYEPDVAKKLAEAVLAKSEALVNAMSRRAQDDAITLAMREVKTAEGRVSKAQEAMRAFRDRSGMLDPTSTAGGLQGIVSQLESEVVKVKAEIAEASTYMSKDAPALVGLRARLAAVEKQLAAEKLRLAGESKPGSMTSIAGEYEDLQIESDFARQQLVSAMASLEAARVKAEAQSRYVVAFQVPVLPDESLYPRPFLFTLFVFVGALVIVGICSLIIAAVREHAGF